MTVSYRVVVTFSVVASFIADNSLRGTVSTDSRSHSIMICLTTKSLRRNMYTLM